MGLFPAARLLAQLCKLPDAPCGDGACHGRGKHAHKAGKRAAQARPLLEKQRHRAEVYISAPQPPQAVGKGDELHKLSERGEPRLRADAERVIPQCNVLILSLPAAQTILRVVLRVKALYRVDIIEHLDLKGRQLTHSLARFIAVSAHPAHERPR